MHCVLPKKTEKACAAARFPVLMLFYGAQNGHGTVVDETGPLPHRGLLTLQRTGLVQPDVGDLAGAASSTLVMLVLLFRVLL